MSLEFRFCPVFKSILKNLLISFPNAEKNIVNTILSLKDDPRGNPYPGFQEFLVKKIRLSLKEYRIGKRKGLRFIYLLVNEKNMIIPLHIYKKGGYKKEDKVKKSIKENLKQILEELKLGECSKSLLA